MSLEPENGDGHEAAGQRDDEEDQNEHEGSNHEDLVSEYESETAFESEEEQEIIFSGQCDGKMQGRMDARRSILKKRGRSIQSVAETVQ